MKKHELKTLSERLLYAIELTGIKKSELARAISVQPQTIQHLCTGNVRSSRFTFELATILGLNTKWLATGEGEMFLSEDPKNKLFREYKQVPVLNLEQLTMKAKGTFINNFDVNEWELLRFFDSDIFCFKINDSSMLPFLKPNSRLFFKPIISKSNIYKEDDTVIAYVPNFNSIIVRKIIHKNDVFYLSPINQELFKELELNTEIIIFGIMVEYHYTITS